MADRFFVVELTGGPPGDPAYLQPVRAAKVLEVKVLKEKDYLHFLEESGKLSGLFLRSIVRNWREATEEKSRMWSNQGSPQS